MTYSQLSSDVQTPESVTGITVRCFTPLGAIPGMGRIEVEAREYILLDSHHIQQFIGIQVTSGDQYSQTQTATIPYESIDQCLAAIDRLAAVNPNSTKYKQIEVEFSLETGFRLVVFTDAKGKLMFSVNAQAASAYFGDLHKLADLKSLITKAKTTIDENRPRT